MPSVRQILVENVIKTIPVGLLVISPKGTVMVFSPSAQRLLGMPAEAVEERDWKTLLRDEPANRQFQRNLTEAVENGRPFRHVLVDYRRPDGEINRFP